MAKTIRQYAEEIKQASGTALGIYEMSLQLPAGTATTPAVAPTTWVTNYINALPNSVLAQFSFFPSTGDIASFVVAVGPVLEQVAPAV